MADNHEMFSVSKEYIANSKVADKILKTSGNCLSRVNQQDSNCELSVNLSLMIT